jgi:molybdenum cofactor cytidylyltransferase
MAETVSEKRPTAGILLAAGVSSRLGRPKQLLRIGRKTLLERCMEAATASALESVVVVLGYEAKRIRSTLADWWDHPKIRTCHNPDYRQGMSISLKAGLAAVRDHYPSVMVMLADQPFIGSSVIDGLLERFWRSTKGICASSYRDRQGPPVCLSRTYYSELMALEGDVGARGILSAHRENVLCVEVKEPEMLMDVDTEEDLFGVRGMFSRSFPFLNQDFQDVKEG